MEAADLERLVENLAQYPRQWEHLIKHEHRRTYAPIPHEIEDVCIWLLCWSEGHDTGFHDHFTSNAGVIVVEGEILEERLLFDNGLIKPGGNTYRRGQSFHMNADTIHRVRHSGEDPAVTIHAYSPPLTKQGSYYISGDGQLKRQTHSSSKTLKPLEEAAQNL